MSSKANKRRRKENELSEQDQQQQDTLPTINQDRLAPRGAFVLPQGWVQGLMTSHLPDLEGNMIREINRLEIWVENLQTQLNAAHDEVDRLKAENDELKSRSSNRQVLSIPR